MTEDRDSGLPRYYYSKFDQYLSPTWSPDGKELILVSNRGDVWGSGGFWRMPAEPGGALRLVRKEETNWKARPDWARDGRRVVYSSYLGRQRNQLWLMTADGGDPFQLTYGEFDAHAAALVARRPPHRLHQQRGRRHVALRMVDDPGRRDRRRRPRGSQVRSRPRGDAAPVGRRTPTASPCRPGVSVTGADGRGWAPDDAWRHADDGFDRGERPFEMTYFHTPRTGSAVLSLPPGRVHGRRDPRPGVRAGHAHRRRRPRGGTAALRLALRAPRAICPRAGWWSGDLHVHMNYGGHYRDTIPRTLRAQAEAEDLHVVENLIVNKEQRIPDVARVRRPRSTRSRRPRP